MKKLFGMLIGICLLLAGQALASEVYLPNPMIDPGETIISVNYLGGDDQDVLTGDQVSVQDDFWVLSLSEKQTAYFGDIVVFTENEDSHYKYTTYSGVDATKDLYAVRVRLDGMESAEMMIKTSAHNVTMKGDEATGVFEILLPLADVSDNIQLFAQDSSTNQGYFTFMSSDVVNIADIALGESATIVPEIREPFKMDNATITLTKEGLLRPAQEPVYTANTEEPFTMWFSDPGFDVGAVTVSTSGSRTVDGVRESTYRQLEASEFSILPAQPQEGVLAVAFYPPFVEEVDGFTFANMSFIVTGEADGVVYDARAGSSQLYGVPLYLYKVDLSKTGGLELGDVRSFFRRIDSPQALSSVSSLEVSSVMPKKGAAMKLKTVNLVGTDAMRIHLYSPVNEQGRMHQHAVLPGVMADVSVGNSKALTPYQSMNTFTVNVTKVAELTAVDAGEAAKIEEITPEAEAVPGETTAQEEAASDEVAEASDGAAGLGYIVVTKDGTNVREAGNSDARSLGRVNAGEQFDVVDVASSGWYGFLMEDGQTAYISPGRVEFFE